MNDKFYSLPEKKQERIINAGFRVFSQNTYKKSPMQEIADAAGISKSLLFHYFQNKKELYLFLWDKAADITMEYLTRNHCYECEDLFEMMERGMHAKIQIMCQYPDMAAFAMKAFYEKDSAVCEDIQRSYRKYFDRKAADALAGTRPLFFLFFAYFILQVETASVCFGISAFLNHGGAGIGLGMAALLYFLNIIANLTEEAKFLKYITPFGYTEGADIIADECLNMGYLSVGLVFTVIGISAGFFRYCKKDIL